MPMNQNYDSDGNQTVGRYPQGSGGTRYWDGENRMYRATVGSTNHYFAYDPFGRRVAKFKGSGTGMTGRIYFYDGWNVAAECTIAATTYPLDRTYTWGTDLSGSMHGAGGVGGLLAVEIETGGDAGVYYPTYDGNGNVSEYIDAGGTVVAHYEYDPFGESVIATGGKAALFTYRFSTKPLDSETGYYYYGYRYYDPVTGRWPSRDPIGERGGLNLYGFVHNSPIHFYDYLGLETDYDSLELTKHLIDALEAIKDVMKEVEREQQRYRWKESVRYFDYKLRSLPSYIHTACHQLPKHSEYVTERFFEMEKFFEELEKSGYKRDKKPWAGPRDRGSTGRRLPAGGRLPGGYVPAPSKPPKLPKIPFPKGPGMLDVVDKIDEAGLVALGVAVYKKIKDCDDCLFKASSRGLDADHCNKICQEAQAAQSRYLRASSGQGY